MVKDNEITWEAEEYISHDHNVGWYIGFSIICIGLIILAAFLQWWSFLILVVLSAVVILISIFRPPRKISYTLNSEGLTEDKELHPYSLYRAFGILKEGKAYSAILIPKKRFGIQTKVYFPKKNGEAIVDMLGARLPMEEIKLDFLDKIVNLLRI